MVGAFPRPLHGMAAVNAAVRDALREASATPLVIDTAALSLDRSPLARLCRLPRVLRGLCSLAVRRFSRGTVLYMSVSGGFGQFYEVAYLLLGRLRDMRVFLHHHSFAYLDNPRVLTRGLVRAAGRDAVHITLSPGMAAHLQYGYGVNRVVPVSNTVFFVNDASVGVGRNQLATVGFLGNIVQEKGVFEFLDLMAGAEQAGLPLRARLAGPFQDAVTERTVRARLDALPAVEYVGPQYGAAKDSFYADIDVLAFPTRYVNEAEPITVHEAMCRGIPVIASGRGCIPEVIGTDCGLVIDPAVPFVPTALAQMESWLAHPATFQAASQAAAARFAQTHAENQARWQGLLEEMVGVAPASGGAKAERL